MTSFGSTTGNVLYLAICAAPPARRGPEVVKRLQGDGWDVCAVTTPAALPWIDADLLEQLTGHAVRSQFRGPDEGQFAPRADALLLAPATFNTINKTTAGINDNLVLGLTSEAIGLGYPLALVPWLNQALANHPAYDRSVTQLRGMGAHVVLPDGAEPEDVDRAASEASRWLRSAAT
jgi:phosphopantothenoylcysteine synthetase/decarboxylase